MIAGEGTQVIRRAPEAIVAFILDLEQYRQADTKITRVHWVRRQGDGAEVCYSGRFRGVPTPPVRQTVAIEPYRRIDVRSKPGTLAHLVSPFHGSFTLEDLGDGTTRVVHREQLDVVAPLRWLIEPFLRDWLAADTAAEMVRMKQLLESDGDPARG